MKVILLAAGYGTRLYPLTKNMPKALLKVNNVTLLDRIYTQLQDNDCYLVTNEKFSTHFTEHSNNTYTVINDGTTSNDDRLGAVGDIMYTVHTQQINEDILIVNTDNMFGFDLNNFIHFAQNQENSVAACKDMQHVDKVRNRFGVVVHNEQIITEFQEKPDDPRSTLASVGLYYIKQKDISLVSECAKMSADNTGDMIKHLVKKSKVTVWSFTEAWSDVGTHESLQEASTIFE